MTPVSLLAATRAAWDGTSPVICTDGLVNAVRPSLTRVGDTVGRRLAETPPEAMAREDVVHPGGEPRVRGTHGRRPYGVRGASRSAAVAHAALQRVGDPSTEAACFFVPQVQTLFASGTAQIRDAEDGPHEGRW